jgi:hypothetical protein
MRENGKKIVFAPRTNNSSVLSDPSEFIGIALSGDIERFREYISVHPDIVNTKEKDNGNVALHIAASKGNTQMASYLLSKGANLNIQDIFGNSALHYAADKKRYDMVELLIKCGADVNMKDFRGNTPLHAACVNNDIEVVRILLLNNANPESSDLSDVKPAQKATAVPVKALIERKIQSLKGGDEDQQAKIVTMMSFGIGLGMYLYSKLLLAKYTPAFYVVVVNLYCFLFFLAIGVGLGMAMAKQQQFHAEQRLQHQLMEAQALQKKRPGHAGAFVGSFASTQHADSGSAHSPNSSQLKQAGAMVLHNGGRPPPPQHHDRRLL